MICDMLLASSWDLLSSGVGAALSAITSPQGLVAITCSARAVYADLQQKSERKNE
jgi:hypothetical protein